MQNVNLTLSIGQVQGDDNNSHTRRIKIYLHVIA